MAENGILVIAAHPDEAASKVHSRLLSSIESQLPNVAVRRLYDLYPSFHIDVEAEQKALSQAKLVVWLHPIYWYNAPAILKEWIDRVLEHGWAYGKDGTALKGKKVLSAISSGGTHDTYQAGGFHGATLDQYLLPFKSTAELCNMSYEQPFWVQKARALSSADADQEAQRLVTRLKELA